MLPNIYSKIWKMFCGVYDTDSLAIGPWRLKAKLACHPARCLLPVEIIKRCDLATGPATVELLPY